MRLFIHPARDTLVSASNTIGKISLLTDALKLDDISKPAWQLSKELDFLVSLSMPFKLNLKETPKDLLETYGDLLNEYPKRPEKALFKAVKQAECIAALIQMATVPQKPKSSMAYEALLYAMNDICDVIDDLRGLARRLFNSRVDSVADNSNNTPGISQVVITATLRSAAHEVRKIANLTFLLGMPEVSNTAYQLCEELTVLDYFIEPENGKRKPANFDNKQYTGLVELYQQNPHQALLVAIEMAGQLPVMLDIAREPLVGHPEKQPLHDTLNEAANDLDDVSLSLKRIAEQLSSQAVQSCSFCGRQQHEVRKLFGSKEAGFTHVRICDQCVAACQDKETGEVKS